MKPIIITMLILLSGCKTPDIIDDLIGKQEDTPIVATAETYAMSLPQTWHGVNLSGVTIDATLHSVTIKGKKIFFDYAPVPWETGRPLSSGTLLLGRCIMMREIDGVLVGGQYEWFKPNMTFRETGNIHKLYNKHTVPAHGETVYFCLGNIKGSKRSNIVSATWD